MEKVPLDTLMRVTVSERKHNIHESQKVMFLKGTSFNRGWLQLQDDRRPHRGGVS